jgi:hypothetical protein
VMPPVCGPINIPEIIYPNISGKRRRWEIYPSNNPDNIIMIISPAIPIFK